MIYSARPTVPPVEIIIFTWKLFCFGNILASGYGRKEVRLNDMCENSNQYNTDRDSWIN